MDLEDYLTPTDAGQGKPKYDSSSLAYS